MTQLALEGGNPVRETFLPYGLHWIEEDDIDAVVQILREGWITTGPEVQRFEEEFAEVVGARYAVAVSSGTAALHAAVYAAGVEKGDEVITTPLTFVASSNCVLYQGGKPVFADVEDDTLNIDPDGIVARIGSGTKAIIAMDYAGHPCDLDTIGAIAKKHGLALIEDAAHALGAQYQGKPVGALSDLTIFSLHPVKHITTGEGGIVTTNDLQLVERLRVFRNHGITTSARQREVQGQWYYEMVDLGYNYRLTDFQCALGRSQLAKLKRFVERRREIAARYREKLSQMAELMLPVERNAVCHAWHIYPVRLRLESLSTSRDQVFAALRAENIGVNVHYIPVHLHPYYRHRFGYKEGDYPVAETAYRSLLTLPIFPKMTDADVDDVVDAVQKVLRRYHR